jgi:hypothetical protein
MTRELTGHRVNGVNEALRVIVLDKPGSGGACHDYVVLIPVPSFNPDSFNHLGEPLMDDEARGILVNEVYVLPNGDNLSLFPVHGLATIPNGIAVGGEQGVNFYRYQRVTFQNGPIKEAGVNGTTQEVLLAILIDRLEGFQSGEFKNRDNAVALTHIETAKLWLHKRTMDRAARGVEGTLQK